jgi:hypothetical protein
VSAYERLAARVRAVNKANAYARDTLYPALVEIFRPLCGTAILKADGSLRASVARSLPDFPNRSEIMVYRDSSDYSLRWTVKTCEMIRDEQACLYHETTVYLGSLDGNTLKPDLYGPPDLRSDYTPEEVIDSREKYLDAKRVADAARDALYPFGESDR